MDAGLVLPYHYTNIVFVFSNKNILVYASQLYVLHSSSNLGCMKVGKASRAQWHTALHADVFGLLNACSIVASVCIFSQGELGPVISCAKPDLTGYFGDCSVLQRRWVHTGSSSSTMMERASIYLCTSYRGFKEEAIHLFKSRHQVEAPGIYNGHVQKNVKTLGRATACSDITHWSTRLTQPMC